MEWWSFLKTLWAISALIVLALACVAIWRGRGIFVWQKSIKAELAELKAYAQQNSLPIKRGVRIIEDTCSKVMQSLSPEFGELQALPLYIKSIAACFHPNSDCPERQVRVKSLLQTLEKSLNGFDCILQRPGFNKLKSINIRKIKKIQAGYLRLSESFLYQWVSSHKKMIQRFSHLHLLLFLDPLVWLVYLSRRLTTLMLIKYLMVDLYIFVGRLALETYGDIDTSIPDEGEAALEETLAELEALENNTGANGDPQVHEIRNQLVGFPALLFSNPTFDRWWSSVRKAATVISTKHFPEADHPLEEAALGPLLESARRWAGKIAKGNEHLLTSYLYNVRLETLYRTKSLSDAVIPQSVQNIIKKSYKTYGWLKWPLKVYRWGKRAAPWKIALEIGWAVSKKASLAYIHAKTFDMVCEELEKVYYLSRESG